MTDSIESQASDRGPSPAATLEILAAGLELLSDGVALFDQDFRLVACNQQFVRLMRFPEGVCRPGAAIEELVRDAAARGIYGDSEVEAVTQRRIEELRRLEPHAFERQLADGTVVRVRCAPIPNRGLLITYGDVTESRRTERSLRESEDRHALAMEAINEAVFDWDVETGEIYYSPRVEAIFGLGPDQLKTVDDWNRRVHPDDWDRFRGALIALLKGQAETLEIEYRYRAKDDSWR